MPDVSKFAAEQLRTAIEQQHDGRATFVSVELIDERPNSQPVWQGHVHVFDRGGHPMATRPYACSSPVERSSKRRFYAVLHLGPIRSARDAVKAAIVAEQRRRA